MKGMIIKNKIENNSLQRKSYTSAWEPAIAGDINSALVCIDRDSLDL